MFYSLLPIVLGAVVGFGWYRLVGCSTGSCLITSTWWSSTAYGALMGYLTKMSLFG